MDEKEFTPVVYVPNIPTRADPVTKSTIPTIDLSPATKFGELAIITQGVGAANPGIIHDSTSKIYSYLESWRPGDYLMVAGDPLLFALALAALAKMNPETDINVLRWNRKRAAYDELVIPT